MQFAAGALSYVHSLVTPVHAADGMPDGSIRDLNGCAPSSQDMQCLADNPSVACKTFAETQWQTVQGVLTRRV